MTPITRLPASTLATAQAANAVKNGLLLANLLAFIPTNLPQSPRKAG